MLFPFLTFGASSDGASDEIERQIERGFPSQPDSVPAARRFVLEVAATGDSEVDERLAALVSELATNAVLHARTPFRIRVWLGGGRIRVAVSDLSVLSPVPRAYVPSQPTGRGLMIVESLADDWGVTPEEKGKSVWFEIERGAA
jgi:anti-sigma regulatory factor (Ser/Thr protein kinase)